MLKDRAAVVIVGALICCLGPFSNGFQSLPPFLWLFNAALLLWIRIIPKPFFSYISVFIFLWISSWIGYYNIFGGVPGEQQHPAIVLLILFPLLLVQSLGLVFTEKFLIPSNACVKLYDSIIRTILTPALWAFSWAIVTLISPTGTFGMPAFTQSDITIVRYVNSFVGPYGIEFFLMLFGSMFADLILVFILDKKPSVFRVNSPFFPSERRPSIFVMPSGIESPLLANSDNHHPQTNKKYKPFDFFPDTAKTFFIVILPLIFFGGIWEFFSLQWHVGQPTYIPGPHASGMGSLRFTCSTSNTDTAMKMTDNSLLSDAVPYPDLNGNFSPFSYIDPAKANTDQMNTSKELTKSLSKSQLEEFEAARPIDVVLYAESAANDGTFPGLKQKARQNARGRRIIAVSSTNVVDSSTKPPKEKNEVALYVPWEINGLTADQRGDEPDFTEAKRHAVPLVENLVQSTTAGRTLPISDLKFRGLGSNIGATICFDLDNQDSWRSMPLKTFVLNPSWTWGPDGFWKLHGARQRFISDALGIPIVRCVHDGQSMVYSPFGLGGSSGLTGWREEWQAMTVQPRFAFYGNTFFAYVLRFWYGDIVLLGLMSILSVCWCSWRLYKGKNDIEETIIPVSNEELSNQDEEIPGIL